ncbi:MAG: hypothetical protein Q8909_05605 [Bacteroidota bacterium]|nr:hypothetical protein [Bacteroidota bacterium]
MESNTFSWERVWALLVRYWEEQRGKLFAVMMAAAALMFFGFSTAGKHSLVVPVLFNVLAVVSKIGFTFCLLYHIHLGFAVIKEKKYCSRFLLMPATSQEKFVFLLLSSVFIPALFYITLFIALAIAFQMLFHIEFVSFLEYAFFVTNKLTFDAGQQFLMMYSSLVVLIFGQFLFKKNATIKTLLSFIGLSVVLSNIEELILYLIFQPANCSIKTEFLGGLTLKANMMSDDIDRGLFSSIPHIYTIALFSFVTVLGYVCYLRFKEKQVKV